MGKYRVILSSSRWNKTSSSLQNRIGLFFIFSVAIISSGCGFNTNESKAKVDTAINEASLDLKNNYLSEHDSLNLMYQRALPTIKDSLTKQKIKIYYVEINKTINCINVLKAKTDSLSDSDLDVISKVFIPDSAGDKLFKQIGLSYSLAVELAKNKATLDETNKSRNKILSDSDYHKLLAFYFGQNDPKQATWMLYGFQLEIMEVAINNIKSYN